MEEAGLDEGAATKAVAEAQERHYQVDNKRGVSVTALTRAPFKKYIEYLKR